MTSSVASSIGNGKGRCVVEVGAERSSVDADSEGELHIMLLLASFRIQDQV